MIRVEQDGPVTALTLDRTNKRNALTGGMLEDLIAGVEAAPGPLVMTGAGGVFSAGADLEAARAGLATSPLWERLSGTIAAHPHLTVAALNGTCAGGALGMVLACDIRLSVPEATFFYPVAKLGFLPQPSDPVRLAGLTGSSRAKLMLAGGARWDAFEALTFGLVDRVVPDPVAAARELVSAGEPGHVAAIKAMVP
ncbi:enoyl-CoA hydratase/isomerase family protein [Jannaschia aquimarina]|uniref:EchA6 protein n=1 Tax=Jannaschia aquimarina TaxID=935700 RepID=A0A0D1EGB9_9RHOB|nr:enoyl-CoA hydratase/isomerase family protein [Jannaschia aquimarina]KIT16699.1 putative enoyl-CoA hydratase echA6 [Jannaschia aquimarina]SNS54771.1 Enoyl-CoA hydratase/carnithine racemase [Jannaschia aquimarina]